MDQREALGRVDALAQRTLEWSAPIRFGRAGTSTELAAVYGMRYQVVVDRGWMQPEDLPEAMERDKYDDLALHLVGWDGDTLAAACRLVFPKPGIRLPTEVAYEIEVEPRGQVVDAGRFIVGRTYSDMTHRLLAGLFARSWLEMRACDYVHVCAAFASPAMIRLYQRMGCGITVLAPARRYWGEDRFPVRFDIPGSAPTVFQRVVRANDTSGNRVRG